MMAVESEPSESYDEKSVLCEKVMNSEWTLEYLREFITYLKTDEYMDIDIQSMCTGRTALMYCVSNGLESEVVEQVNALIEMGADVDILDKTGRNIMFYVVSRQNLDVLKSVLTEEPTMNIRDIYKQGVFTQLRRNIGESELTFVNYLLENSDWDIDEPCDEVDNTPLLYVIQHMRVDPAQTVVETDFELERMLLCNAPDVNAKNKYGVTASHLACMYGHSDVFIHLNGFGADMNQLDIYGNGPLVYAVRHSNTTSNTYMVYLALKFGANINSCKNKKKYTPLHYACKYAYDGSNYDTIDMLLNSGADVNLKSANGHTPISILLKESKDMNTTQSIEDYLSVEDEVLGIKYSVLGTFEKLIRKFIKCGLNISTSSISKHKAYIPSKIYKLLA